MFHLNIHKLVGSKSARQFLYPLSFFQQKRNIAESNIPLGMFPTVKSSGSEICEARRALDSLGYGRPKRAALPESRESETCCEALGRVSAAAVESRVRRTDERF